MLLSKASEPESSNGEPVGPVAEDRGFADSPLEESGFEPLVPLTPKNGSDTGERDAQKSTR